MISTKTFRLFISSPFTDFKGERAVLHEQVFPFLEEHCAKEGFQFQPIDLRWGVNNESQLDQKTLEMCLDEVRACKSYPSPHFLIMQGDRYGYIPAPYMIEELEFHQFLSYVDDIKLDLYLNYPSFSDKNDIRYTKKSRVVSPSKLLKEWYQLDTNQIPASYFLKRRKDDYIHYLWWNEEEIALRAILQTAATCIIKNKQSYSYKKYFLSATEQEFIEGISKDDEYLYAFLRDLSDSDDLEASRFKNDLRSILRSTNIIENKQINEENYLEDFKNKIQTKLLAAIDAQITKNNSYEAVPLKQEQLAQKLFKDTHSQEFLGRNKILKDIEQYIRSSINTPLIVHGPSGMGKSALLAKSITQVSKNHQNILYRFIGATVNSSINRNLLVSILDELQENQCITKIDNYEQDTYKFTMQVKNALESVYKDTVLYIDALDQLQSYDQLQWLPKTLSPHIKIIISVLNDGNYLDDSKYYQKLSRYYSDNFIDILENTLEDVAPKLITKLLKKDQRQISTSQMTYILDCFEKAKFSPLYLKIIIEEVKNWRSHQKDHSLETNARDAIMEYLGNLTEFYHIEELMVHKCMGYILCSKDGLEEKEILEILSDDLTDE